MSESPAQEALSVEAAIDYARAWEKYPGKEHDDLKLIAEGIFALAQQLEQDGLTIRDLQASEKHYHDLWKKAEQQGKLWLEGLQEQSALRHQAEQRIKELETALEIAVSCVGNYAADSNLGEALAAVGINRHPEEDSDGG
jgi:hypothetical protein